MSSDLHFHSTDSDGRNTNTEILAHIESIDPYHRGIWAMTNHDLYTEEFVRSGRAMGIRTVWATEISAHCRELDTSLHITCYTPGLIENIQTLTNGVLDGKHTKILAQIEKLRSQGFPIEPVGFSLWIRSKGYRLSNVSNAHITEYLFDTLRVDETLAVLSLRTNGKVKKMSVFLSECLKQPGEFAHIGVVEVPPYEPELSDLISLSQKTDMLISVAHPNFSFAGVYKKYGMNTSIDVRMQCFREKVLPILSRLGVKNYEINTKATLEQVKLISNLVKNSQGYITFGSDSHNLGSEDSKHGGFSVQNPHLREEMIQPTLSKLREFSLA